MAPDNADLRLPAILDVNAAADLTRDLLQLKGRNVTLEASEVERLGALCLQVLLSARATWRQAGLRLEIAGRSAAFDDALALFGAPAFDA